MRSETLSERDRSKPTRFVINDGENSAFDMAIRVSPGTVSHFYSADLTKEEGYRNQRLEAFLSKHNSRAYQICKSAKIPE